MSTFKNQSSIWSDRYIGSWVKYLIPTLLIISTLNSIWIYHMKPESPSLLSDIIEVKSQQDLKRTHTELLIPEGLCSMPHMSNDANSDKTHYFNTDPNAEFIYNSANYSRVEARRYLGIGEYSPIYNQPWANEYRNNPPNNRSTFLTIFVLIASHRWYSREVIRDTWGSIALQKRYGFSVYFVLGACRDNACQQRVYSEQLKYNDIIQKSMPDHYSLLALKTELIVNLAAAGCPLSRYYAKIDSDVLLNVELLVRTLKKYKDKKSLVLGWMHSNQKVDRDPSSRVYVPWDIFPQVKFPPYLMGFAYIISGDLMSKVAPISKTSRFMTVEDVSLGLWMRLSQVPPPNVYPKEVSKLFYKEPHGEICQLAPFIAMHLFVASKLRDAWDQFTSCPAYAHHNTENT